MMPGIIASISQIQCDFEDSRGVPIVCIIPRSPEPQNIFEIRILVDRNIKSIVIKYDPIDSVGCGCSFCSREPGCSGRGKVDL